MTAAELIEQIKKLSAGDQARVVEFMRQYELAAGTEPRIEEDAILKKASEAKSNTHGDIMKKLSE